MRVNDGGRGTRSGCASSSHLGRSIREKEGARGATLGTYTHSGGRRAAACLCVQYILLMA